MFIKSAMVFVICGVLGVNCIPFPFKMMDEYTEGFGHGMDELKKLSLEYCLGQEDWHFDEHHEIQALKEAEEYDFIIVGGGTSGSVLANRLSEVPEWKVLLLEAGSPETIITQTPAMYPYLQTTPYNWGYTTVPQKTACLGMEDYKCGIGSGKALGGSSAINDMLYTRGHPKDYDIWADAGLKGWCWTSVLPYFKKIEDTYADGIDRKYHRLGGPMHVENFRYDHHLAGEILQGAHEIGIKQVDYNGKEQLGFGLPQVTTKDGKRYSTAQAYLEPAHKRKNLVIRPLCEVTKILISHHTKEASGVQFVHDGHVYVAKARKEVILAAGPINTPKLLMLSGIGPKEHLEHLKIEPVSDLKVGHNLKDHLSFIGLNFIFNHTRIEERNAYYSEAIDYLRNGKGPLSTTGAELIGFLKTNHSKDKTDYPDVEFLITNNLYNKGHEHLRSLRIKKEIYDAIWKPLEDARGFTIQVVLLHPKSSGYVKLHDVDPLHHPLLDLNALSDDDEHDIETMVAGIKLALKLAHTEALQKLGIHLNPHPLPFCEKYEFSTDDYWKCAVKHLSVSLKHFTGTAKMGPDTDREAVVDEHLKVYGVHNLRVADASVIPVTISGHTTAVTVMIGEKAAKIIQEDWQ